MFKHKRKHRIIVMFVTNFSGNQVNQEAWSPIDTYCYTSTHIYCWVVVYAQDLGNYPQAWSIEYYVYGNKYLIKKPIFIWTAHIIIHVASLLIKVTCIFRIGYVGVRSTILTNNNIEGLACVLSNLNFLIFMPSALI